MKNLRPSETGASPAALKIATRVLSMEEFNTFFLEIEGSSKNEDECNRRKESFFAYVAKTVDGELQALMQPCIKQFLPFFNHCINGRELSQSVNNIR